MCAPFAIRNGLSDQDETREREGHCFVLNCIQLTFISNNGTPNETQTVTFENEKRNKQKRRRRGGEGERERWGGKGKKEGRHP